MITVRCLKCGARFETALPPASVRRIARCPHCGLKALEIVEEGPASEKGPSSG